MKLRHILGVLRDSYCRTVGIEYMHIQDPDQRRWIQDRVERPYNKPTRDEQLRILRRLNAAEAFETFLQTKYVGQKRFSLEGGESVIPLLDALLSAAAERGPRRGLRRHAAPRPAQRAREHRRQELRPDLPRVRGHAGPAQRAGLRRREVPPGHRGHVHRGVRRDDEGLPRGQPLPPGGGQPGARGRRAGQAGPARPRAAPLPRAARADARGRRVRRAGRGRRDPQPVPAARVPHRRHRPRRHQQPGRVHHAAGGVALVGVLHRRRQDDPGADLPRERRRPRGLRAGRPARVRLPAGVREGRRHRHRLLPPPRSQRGRRPVDDPAADVLPDRGQAQRPQAVHRVADRPRRHQRRGGRAGAARLPAAAGARVRRDPRDRRPRRAAAGRRGRSPRAWSGRRRSRTTRSPRPARRRPSTWRCSSGSATRTSRRPRSSPCTRSCGRCWRSARRCRASGGIDWGFGEVLAFGSLLLEGTPVRARRSGQPARHVRAAPRRPHRQDHRPASGRRCSYLARGPGAVLDLRLAAVSEFAAMGFEYGYSVERPDALVLWEAQFGDFVNGAQTIVDEFISSSEQKWGQRSSVVHAAPARLRGAGPGPLLGPDRAVPADVRREQHDRGDALDARRRTSTCCGARPTRARAGRWWCSRRSRCCG